MKLLLDEMLDREIAVQLRRRGHDVLAIQERPEWWGVADERLLSEVALTADRALVTDNVRDFLPLHAALITSGAHHAGLLLAAPSKYPRSKRALGLWVSALDAYLAARHEDADLTDMCDWL